MCAAPAACTVQNYVLALCIALALASGFPRATAAESGHMMPNPAPDRASSCTCSLAGSWVTNDNVGIRVAQVNGASRFTATNTTAWTGGWQRGDGTVSGLRVSVTLARADNITTALAGSAVDYSSNCSACDRIQWGVRGYWDRVDHVRTVQVVQMTHLDVGFTNYAKNVCSLYFNQHFPAAIATAQQLRAKGGDARFRYTSHPWLVSELLHGTAGCATVPVNDSVKAAVRDAIGRGDIAWHGKPMNIFPELAGADLFDAGLAIAPALNREFGTAWGTVLAKSTDVPGLSRGVVPLLAKRTLQAVHMGYNSACLMADIPSVFVWRDEASNTSVVAMAEDNYGSRVIVHGVPGFDVALAFQYTLDNGPPPNATEVEAWWATQQIIYPHAKLELGSLDSFATDVVTRAAPYLPVVTKEVGDSWLYGSPADPYKLAGLRAAMRLKSSMVKAGSLDANDPDMVRFEARLLKPPEHNWGLSVGQYFPQLRSPVGNWSNMQFHKVDDGPRYRVLEAAWVEERSFLTPLPAGTPVQRVAMGLPPSPSAGWQMYAAQLAELLPPLRFPDPPSLAGFAQQSLNPSQDVYHFQCPLSSGGSALVGFRGTDGAIVDLQATDGSASKQWAGPTTPLARLTYQTYNLPDYNVFNEGYNPGCGPPCGDFSKAGMESASPTNSTWLPRLTSLWYKAPGAGAHKAASAGTSDPLACSFVAALELPPAAPALYGAAQRYWVTVSLAQASDAVDADDTSAASVPALALDVNLTWVNKTATRLAEATWMSFTPVVRLPTSQLPARRGERGATAGAGIRGAQTAPSSAPGWRVDVLGTQVDPLNVVVNGTRHVHGVWDGVTFAGDIEGVVLRSLDAPIVSPGSTQHLLLYAGEEQPDLAGGWHWNVHNNLWGTAFPQWYGDSAHFRFQVELVPHGDDV